MRNNYIVLDLETGGLDKLKDAILQFGFVVLDLDFKELDKGETLVKSEKRNVTPKALEINGLNLEECENKGATREQLYEGIKKIFEKFTVGNFKPIVVGHNSGFDIGFLNELFLEFEDDFGNYREMYFVCTKFQMFQRYPNLAAHSLKACCSKFNIVNEKSHTALSDTLATAKLLVELSKEAVSSIELSEEERIVKFSF